MSMNSSVITPDDDTNKRQNALDLLPTLRAVIAPGGTYRPRNGEVVGAHFGLTLKVALPQ